MRQRRWLPLVLVLLLAMVAMGAAAPRQIILTWQGDTQTSMTVTWRTNSRLEEGVVLYTSDPSKDLSEYERATTQPYTFPQTRAWLYSVELTDLTPGTEYTVVLGSDRGWSEPFTFETAPSERREIVFAVGGDSRSDQQKRREVNKMAAEASPDFVVFTGDMIATPDNEAEWDHWFNDWHELMITPEGRRIPIIPAIGNHEVIGSSGQTKAQAPFYYNRFNIPDPESYYVLTYGPDLTIITLDSDHTATIHGAQLEWLERTLQMYQDSTWIIVQYHVAAWPSVRGFNERVPFQIRHLWIPLFEQYGVDLVIEAHDHAYKRTEPIFDNQVDYERGIVYIGDGGWGAPLRENKAPALNWWLAESASAYHYFKITLSADAETMTVEPVFYTDPQVTYFVPQGDGFDSLWRDEKVHWIPKGLTDSAILRRISRAVSSSARRDTTLEDFRSLVAEDFSDLTPELQEEVCAIYQTTLDLEKQGKAGVLWALRLSTWEAYSINGTPFTLQRRSKMEFVEEVPEELAELKVTVVDQSGRPVVGARVSSTLTSETLVTGMDGVLVQLPLGEHELTLEWANHKQTKIVNLTEATEVGFTLEVTADLYLTFDDPAELRQLNPVTGIQYYVNQWALGKYDSTGLQIAGGALYNTSTATPYLATKKAYGDAIITFSTIALKEPEATQGMRVFFRESGLVDENHVFTGWGLNHSTYALDFALWAPHPTEVDPNNPHIKARMASRVGMTPPRQNDRDLRVVSQEINHYVAVLQGNTLTLTLNGAHVTTFPWDPALSPVPQQGRVVFSLPAWGDFQIQNIAIYEL